MSNQLMTPAGRLIWANLDEPKFKKNFTNPSAPPPANEKPKYRLSMIFDQQAQKDPLFAAMDTAMVNEAAAAFGRRAEPNWPLKPFDPSKKWAGFQPGDVYLQNASSLDKIPMFVFNPQGERELTDRLDLFYPGAGVAALISFVGYHHAASGNDSVLCNVHALVLMDPNLPMISGGGPNVIDGDAFNQIVNVPKYRLPPPKQAGQPAHDPETGEIQQRRFASPNVAAIESRRRLSPG